MYLLAVDKNKQKWLKQLISQAKLGRIFRIVQVSPALRLVYWANDVGICTFCICVRQEVAQSNNT